MPFAIRMHQTGGPEVMCWEELEVGDPAPGEARVRHQAVGLNYIDIYHRSGLYPLQLPNGLGLEAAGCVEAVGAGVSDLHPGDRVAYAGGPVGAYSQVRCLPADRLLKLPENIDFRTAAAMMLQGLTSAYLLRRTYRVQAGDSVLIHAAAGGVGLIACQWAKALGATVIGTVSGAAKAALALAHAGHFGCRSRLLSASPPCRIGFRNDSRSLHHGHEALRRQPLVRYDRCRTDRALFPVWHRRERSGRH